ncbi:hypothetical protein H5410_041411, partial [Solanum commersonii]
KISLKLCLQLNNLKTRSNKVKITHKNKTELVFIVFKKCAPKDLLAYLCVLDNWARQHFFAESLGNMLTAPFHRQFAPFLQGSTHWNKRRICNLLVIFRMGSAIRRSSFLRYFSFFCSLLHDTNSSSVIQKGVLNSSTQDSIIYAHNKTQFTYAKIHCALKNSSSDSPILENLMLTILASNASSSSTKESDATLTLTKMKTMHAFTHRFARIFQLTFVSVFSRSK